MIYKAFQTLTEFINATGRTGLDGTLVYVATIEPLFPKLMLFGFFLVGFLGSMFSQWRLRNRVEFVGSFFAGAFSTLVVAVLMSLIDGLISLQTLIIVITVTIVSLIWLLIAKDK